MLTKLLPIKQNALADIVRILIYKEDASLLTKVNLEDDHVFLEPLLMAYFNKAQTEKSFPEGMLPALLQGFFLEAEIIATDVLCNTNDIAYVPEKGYYKKGATSPFEGVHIIPETTVEVLKYEVPLLRNVIHIVSKRDPIAENDLVMNTSLFDHNITPLTNAFQHLKKNNSDFYNLIDLCVKKCAFYKLIGRYSRSFASINANGTIYFAIPDGKDAEDEVYFLDMIGFFTGKMLHTTLFHKQEELFKINHRTRTTEIVETEEHRNIYTLYNNTFCNVMACVSLESCVTSDTFSEQQQQDAKARMALYLKKYQVDSQKLEAVIAHFSGIENVFVKDGIQIYHFMTNHANRILENHEDILDDFDFSNFHYRMEYPEFSKINS
ncbi:hypothetical protein C8N46_101725 [Kordia periserrulae]|uniref:Uncharacterized protein n=1 Tax=Kordia periserrulae TaxID=701523 RepID=A0A2T6C746_9FLAO|nr:hypothetical protein [Kordia periserrulae]PTX64115.1 hypothetical protein C8N46_101725 [Kordia periserrulae]